MINYKKNNSLSFKLLASILLFSSAITILATAIQLYNDYKNECDILSNKIIQIEKSHLKGLTESIWAMESNLSQIQINGINQIPSIEYIEIIDEKNNQLFSTGTLPHNDVMTKIFPIVYNDNGKEHYLGKLHVTASLDMIYNRLYEKAIYILISQSIKTFMVSIFILLMIRYFFTKHISKIAEFTKNINVSNMTPLSLNKANRSCNNNPDEIDVVVNALNEMSNNQKISFTKLEEKEEQYRTLINNLNVGIFRSINTTKNWLIQCNPETLKLIKCRSIEEANRTLATKFHPNRRKRLFFYKELSTHGEIKNHEFQLLRNDGSLIWVNINAKASFNSDGTIKWIDGVIEDISKYKDSKERLKQINRTFEHFVPRQFLNRVAKKGIENIELGKAESENMAILFSDIRSFTNLSETMIPQEVLDFLNEYIKRMNIPISEHNGFVDKFVGDGILALFDIPNGTNADQAIHAVKAAISMQDELSKYNIHRKSCGYVPISSGIGIHCGPVIIGTVGSEDRMDTTVLGDSVNIASRLENLTKYYSNKIIISSQTKQLVENDRSILTREIDFVSVKGKNQPLKIFEVYNNDSAEIQEKKTAINANFKKAIAAYRAKEWQESLKLFNVCLEKLPEDEICKIHILRCKKHINTPPDQSWNGAQKLHLISFENNQA